jgi:hypothetical protein
VVVLFLGEGQIARLLGVGETIESSFWVYAASLLALALGFVPAYVLYLRHSVDPSQILERHGWISAARNVLLDGYGFDRFYSRVFADSVVKIGGSIRQIQTGVLGKNMWGIMIFLIIVALVVLLI